MKKNIYAILKKIVNKLYYSGVFEILIQKSKSNTENKNIEIGVNCIIDGSTVFITPENSKVILKGNNYLGRNTEIQPVTKGVIKIGFGTSIQDRNIIIGDVEFGRYCLTAPNVYISSGRHYFDLDPFFYIKDQDQIVRADTELSSKHSRKITIEDDVWIGTNCVIMSGIKIGRGSVIGSNSVVTKDVPPFSVMAGSPAKLIKKRLELVPKNEIIFENNFDLPNFFKGFFVNVEKLNKSRPLAGIFASYHFVAFLSNISEKLEITIKNLFTEPVILSYNNQKFLVVNGDYTTLTFYSANDFYHEFKIESSTIFDDNVNYFLVKSIKII